MNALITDTTSYLNKLQNIISKLEINIKNTVPINVFDEFKLISQTKYEKLFQKVKTKNQNKIKKLLIKKQGDSNNDKNKTNWIENLTETTIPEYAAEVLSLGPNFAIEATKEEQLPIEKIICNIETSINHLTHKQKDELRGKTSNVLTNFKNKLKNHNKNSQFMTKVNKTKKFLKNNSQLKILKADKTNKTVVMTSIEYDNKMNQLLNDKKTYKQIKRDPTNIHQKTNNELIDNWEKREYIAPNLAKTLKIRNAIPPKIYGLPKLHKDNIPLRPIVSCIQSPFSLLSKFLKNILNNITGKNEYYIKDSFHFKEKLKNIKIPNNYLLISLDVVSLYTNIPIALATKIIKRKWSEIKKYTDIPLDEFIYATELTLKSTYFLYENVLFKQIEGCAMGSSISSVVAQLVMEDLETTVLSKMNFEIPFFFRYVDDIITAVPQDQVENTLKKFNEYHKKLQFTVEKELNNKINFLDVTVHHNQEILKTEWYTKKTWSARYLNFKSHHPINQRKSVIIGLADRAIQLSDPEYREAAITKAKEALQLNNYPLQLINKIFKDRIHSFYNTKQIKNQNNTKKTKYVSIPFVNGLSQQLQHLWNKYDINVCHKSHILLSSNFSRLKTKTPQNKKSNIIYEIPCNDCNGVYIGQTSQYLENRIKSHKYDKKNATALTNHENSEKHKFNFENTKIIGTECNNKKREILESIAIQKNQHTINDKKDVNNLSKIYLSVI